MEAEEKIVFIMEGKIPTYYDAAVSLFQVSKRREDQGKKAISSYHKSLVDCWSKAFGTGHVLSRMAVIKKRYYNEVYTKSHRKTPTHKNERIPTIRSQDKVWHSRIIDTKGKRCWTCIVVQTS